MYPIEFKNITKNFGSVRVLHEVSFSLEAGQLYGLLGENGAGKSTLMKILSGYEKPSSGQILIDNQPVHFNSCLDAEHLGIILIHQEFNLADDLTIAQNIFLGHEIKKGWLLDDQAMCQEAARVLSLVGLSLDPSTLIKHLIIAEKQLVEIAKALAKKANILIMDEPTATLTPSETANLFHIIQQLRQNGVTILYISHKLDEIESITDKIIVMRDGQFITQKVTSSVTRQQMATLMVGREMSDLYPPKIPAPIDVPPLLKVKDFTVPGWANSVSFDIKAGEILGFAGLVGAGRTELFEGLLGLRAGGHGQIIFNEQSLSFKTFATAVKQGISYLSEDRKGKGLHIHLGLTENLTLMALKHYADPWLNPKKEQLALKNAIELFGIRTNKKTQAAASLSGGNQQKLALAKVLQPKPRLIILDEPTRGVDIGAKRDIYFLIQSLAQQGLAVIIISSELIELIGLCHRIAVMRNGTLNTIQEAHQFTEQELIQYATGTHTAL